MIMEDKTLLVPDQYPNIHMALKYLDDKHIKVGKTVTIQVTDCTNQVYTESINVAHPNGNAIHIVGNIDNPENCVLQFNGSNGIEVIGNFELGMISGFNIIGNRTEGTSGIIASEGGRIDIGSSVHISSFEIGVHAREAGKAVSYTHLRAHETV